MSSGEKPAWIQPRDVESVPLERASTIPARWYTDAAVQEWELSELFSHGWQLSGSGSALKNAGDFRVDDIPGTSVLLVRGKDSQLRAFHNVCRHRAGPVAAGAGNCRLLRCRYHGWTYRLDGSLHSAPELGAAEDFDPSDFGLVPLAVTEVGPLALVAPAADANLAGREPAKLFEEIRARIGGLDIDKLQFYRRVSYAMFCNWKVYVDNYLEGYHLPQVHPELTKILDYQDYSTELHHGYSLQYSEIQNPTEAYDAGDAYYYFLFPNIMLNILPGRMQTNVVIPQGPDRCQVIFDYYYGDVTSDAAKTKIEEDISFGDLVQRQDMSICEQVQKGLQSGVYDRGRLSVRREQGVHHFHEMLRAALRRAT